jgi:hypothetical protein
MQLEMKTATAAKSADLLRDSKIFVRRLETNGRKWIDDDFAA